MTKTPPLLIIGMHRSGTALTAQLAEGMGVFMGWRKQGDFESTFFTKLSQWVLEQCGGDWDRPEAIDDLLSHPDVRELTVDYLRYSLATPRAVSFLGPTRYLKYRSILNLDTPWGWKDPRTTFSLPIWLEIFPNARVLHVLRHGVDVAQSLKKRNARTLETRRARAKRLRSTYSLRSKQAGFVNSLRCEDLKAGVELWEEYVRRGRQSMESLGDRGKELRYEDLLEHPADVMRDIAEFAEVEVDPSTIDALCKGVRSARAFAFRKSPELQQLAERERERLVPYGYGV